MKKRNKDVLVSLAALMLLFAAPLKAAELENGKMDRKGFLLGAGLGGGYLHYRSGGTNFNRALFLGDVKIGGGVNENILVMYDGGFEYTKINGINLTIYNALLAVQLFFHDVYYIRPGVGFDVATASTNAAGLTVSTSSDLSFAFQMVGGREFRLGKRFALSPELLYAFSHIRAAGPNDKAHAFGAKASFLWYF